MLPSPPHVSDATCCRTPGPRKALGTGRRRLRGALIRLIAVLTVSVWGPALGQEGATAVTANFSEDEVKAAFLYNFASYVQWPVQAGPEVPITFAILNAPGVETALRRLVEGRTLHMRPVRVRRIASDAELDSGEVLFIGQEENWRLSQLIAAIDGPTLIVTDAPDGLTAGGMINFQLVDQRVRFEVALPSAEAAGLTLSSRLLSAAIRVETTRCWLLCRNAPDDPSYAVQSASETATVTVSLDATAAEAALDGAGDEPADSASAGAEIVVEVEA